MKYIALNSKSEDYSKQLLALRKSRKLHPMVENRLIKLLGNVTPDLHPLKEPQGLAGGRNDLMLFEFSGKKVVFEVFATYSQVSRDLLILHKTQADVKIAVIIDQAVEARVFDRFLRENPDDTFPFVFIGELFEDPPMSCYLKLRELIAGDEEAKFQRMLRAKLSTTSFLNWCKQHGINVFSKDEVESREVSYAQIFITTVLSKCRSLGVAQEQLEKLGQWLSQEKALNYIFLKVDLGFNMFLYTDLEGHFAAYSDMELVDWIRAGHLFSQPHVLLSLNAIIYEFEDKFLVSKELSLNPARKISITIGASQVFKTQTGRDVICSLPRNVESVVLLPPMLPEKSLAEYWSMVKISRPEGTIGTDSHQD